MHVILPVLYAEGKVWWIIKQYCSRMVRERATALKVYGSFSSCNKLRVSPVISLQKTDNFVSKLESRNTEVQTICFHKIKLLLCSALCPFTLISWPFYKRVWNWSQMQSHNKIFAREKLFWRWPRTNRPISQCDLVKTPRNDSFPSVACKNT